jgi:Flp pilus assembly protein TadG
MSLVFVGMGLMAFLSASMLAVDVGMLMTARNQAQNSADAGALAGATALAFDDFDDRSATGPAVTSAITTGKANAVMGATVSLNASDVQFVNDPSGQSNRVKVTVYRRASRGNPLSTLIARFFGTPTADISATATAEASPANAMTCVKPFAIPDRWIEKQTPPWDPSDTFDIYDSKGRPLPNPDVYVPVTSSSYSGYNAERDKGIEVLLKADNGSKIAPSFYYPWAIPGNSGGSDYRRDIGGCNTTIVGFGQDLTPEPGNMVGPTKQGMDDLIAKDPDAYWDPVNEKVVSTKNPSPRIVAIPLFDPEYYESGKHNSRGASLRAVNYLGFFIEEMQGNEVKGRITPIGGLYKGSGYGPAPTGAFPKVIRLVQ